jgi:hypothetical protein
MNGAPRRDIDSDPKAANRAPGVNVVRDGARRDRNS